MKTARNACTPRVGAQEAAENAEMLLIAAENCAEILADLPKTKGNEKARTLILLAYIEGFADGSSRRWIQFIQGDALRALRAMPSESVHCAVTSPPYWGLRDYGTAKWKGGDPRCSATGELLVSGEIKIDTRLCYRPTAAQNRGENGDFRPA